MKFLTAIAQNLRREAESGIARHQLRRGLALTLRKDGGDFILSLSREKVPPGEKEEQACRRAFSVSQEAERHTSVIQDWHIVRLRWKEELRLFELAPETSVYYREGL